MYLVYTMKVNVVQKQQWALTFIVKKNRTDTFNIWYTEERNVYKKCFFLGWTINKKYTYQITIKKEISLVPGIQYALILRQLSHEAGIGTGDTAFLFDEVICFLQSPAVLFHCICYYSRGRAAYTHLTVNQAFGLILSVEYRTKQHRGCEKS